MLKYNLKNVYRGFYLCQLQFLSFNYSMSMRFCQKFVFVFSQVGIIVLSVVERIF